MPVKDVCQKMFACLAVVSSFRDEGGPKKRKSDLFGDALGN
ncbi:MAG: hypothetical protein WCV41_02935 [Patescibacteria group bacterium]